MPQILDDVLDGSLSAAVEAVAGGRLPAAELVEASLARINATPAARACFLSVESERARDAAHRLDAMPDAAKRGLPLCATLIARKDLFSLSGRCTTFGSHRQFYRTGSEDAPVLRGLYDAGAIDLGAVHLAEFAMGPAGWAPAEGFLENPLDGSRVTGGSSSGCAAAVARKLVFGAVGTDTGGSIRIPAAFCGVVGFKPTQGAISSRGVFPVSQTLDTAGPVARSVSDCVLLFDIMASTSERGRPTMPRNLRDQGPIRFAALTINSLPIRPDDDVWTAFCQVTDNLRRGGHRVTEVDLPMLAEMSLLAGIVFLSEAAANHLPHLADHADLIGPQVRERLLQGLAHPAPLYLRAMQMRDHYRDRFSDIVFAQSDVLLLPATPCAAPARAIYDTMPDTGAVLDFNSRIGAYTPAFNYLGAPALSLPAKPAAERSTIGVQIVGMPHQDRLVLQAGVVLESCRG
jgi:aspartyl-tRNA(Asn)/glutamyl-tRNA(Gln) amidotransferase subunit A